MGSRDNNQLISEAELAAAEQTTRRLLAHYDQPSMLQPPRSLTMRTVAVLSAVERRPLSRGPGGRWLLVPIALILVCLLGLGSWGVLGDSSAPAGLFGGVDAAVGRLVLILTLAAKPLVQGQLSVGPWLLLWLVGGLAGAWLWWRMVRAVPPAALLELRR